ncbi:aldehyde dehydrogenase family protein, partial [Streptomyces sp. NPDC004290]
TLSTAEDSAWSAPSLTEWSSTAVRAATPSPRNSSLTPDRESTRADGQAHPRLLGAVHTGDIERGVRFARQIDTGMFHVNDGTVHDEPIVPFGGEKHSGIGRLNGETTIDAFTTQKWISVQHGRSAFPF